MRRSLGRWPGRAALCALIAALAAGPLAAGPVNASATPAAKVEEIEKAGEALRKGQADEAYKLLQEAAKKRPDLPARLMLARLMLNNKDYQQQARVVLEQAATENPESPQVYLTLG